MRFEVGLARGGGFGCMFFACVVHFVSYQLSAISYQLSAISYQLSAISYQLHKLSVIPPGGLRCCRFRARFQQAGVRDVIKWWGDY
jgi:hypothetical protein